MTKIWDIDTEEAFMPMFDEMIGYRAVRLSCDVCDTSYYAAVFPLEDIDPLDDVSVESAVKKISVTLFKGENGWNQTFEPQVGDVITLQDSTRWAVSDVKRRQAWYAITAKSIGEN